MGRMGSIPTDLVNDAFVKKDSSTTRGKRYFNVIQTRFGLRAFFRVNDAFTIQQFEWCVLIDDSRFKLINLPDDMFRVNTRAQKTLMLRQDWYIKPVFLFFSFFVQVNPETGYIDYDRLEENARLFHPRLIIAGQWCF